MAVGDPYLASEEYEQYGLDPDTDPLLVQQACYLIDAWTNHTESADKATTGEVNGLWSGNYKEVRRLPVDRPVMRLVYRPVTAIVTVRGRIKPNRRSDENRLHDALMLLGLPQYTRPAPWVDINPTDCMFETTGRLEVPPHMIYATNFQEIEVLYTAGYEVIPAHVKQAVALLVKELPQSLWSGSTARVRSLQEGDTRMDFFGSGGYMTKDIENLLRDERVRAMV